MGLFGMMLFPLSTGMTISLWAPTAGSPPVPTPDNTIAAFKATGTNAVLVVPSFAVVWARDDSAVEYLSTLNILVSNFCSLVVSALFV